MARASAAASVALLVFLVISQNVGTEDPLTRFDVSVLKMLRRHTTPTGVALFTVITGLGSAIAQTLVGCTGAVLLAVRRQWIILIGWTAAFSGVGLLDYGLKVAIQRPRPDVAAALIPQPASWSFPSGHAMASLVGYGMLAYVLIRSGHLTRRTQVSIIAGSALLIAAIGASRLYLGVHYFSDVLGGYAAGVVWLSVCIAFVERCSTQRTDPSSD